MSEPYLLAGEPAGLDGDARQVPVALPDVSRRTFLKLLGVVMAQATLAGDALEAPAGSWDGEFASPLFRAAALPREAADLLRGAMAELRPQGFAFDLERGGVVALVDEPGLLGVTLQDTRLAPKQRGADIALTVDLRQPQRSALSYVVGESAEEGVWLETTELRPGARPVVRRAHYQRAQTALLTGAPICLSAQVVSYGRIARNHAAPVGSWQESTCWYYAHCCEISWKQSGAGPQLAYGACQEYRNQRSCGPEAEPQGQAWHSVTRRIVL